MEELPKQSEAKEPIPLTYAIPGKGFRASEQALKLAGAVALCALLPIFVLSFSLAVLIAPRDSDVLLALTIAFIIFGMIEVAICCAIVFISCWLRWLGQGSNLSRRKVWPFAAIYVFVSYAMYSAAILFDGWETRENSVPPLWLSTLWVTTVAVWVFIVPWFSRYVLLVPNPELKG